MTCLSDSAQCRRSLYFNAQTLYLGVSTFLDVNSRQTSATADARHQEILPSANSILKYRVTRSYLCCVRETFVLHQNAKFCQLRQKNNFFKFYEFILTFKVI